MVRAAARRRAGAGQPGRERHRRRRVDGPRHRRRHAGPAHVALLGDLAFLHDAGGLLGAGRRDVDCTIVVVDNDGGGIFSFLPQAELVAPDRFETLFGTPHGLDLARLATAYGVPVTRVERLDELPPALEGRGVRVVLVRTERAANVAVHREINDAVVAALKAARSRPGAPAA